MAQAEAHCDEPPQPPLPVSDAGIEPDAGTELVETEPSTDDIVARSRLAVSGWSEGEALSRHEVWKRLRHSPATCFGELHDNPYHHNAQLRALKKVARSAKRSHREMAVGFEMFQRPFQDPLTEYVEYQATEADFLERTEYEDRWGWDFSLYRPLLKVARRRSLPALALNARRELTRQIGREGLESLSPELAALLPELDLEDEEHLEYIYGLFGATHGDPAAAWVENYYVAQTTWDETMASTASDWLLKGERRRLLLFAGVAHCHRSAIPRRIERRTDIEVLSVAPVLRSEWLAAPADWEGYDLLVLLDDSELGAEEEEDSEDTSNPHLPVASDEP